MNGHTCITSSITELETCKVDGRCVTGRGAVTEVDEQRHTAALLDLSLALELCAALDGGRARQVQVQQLSDNLHSKECTQLLLVR